jgi:hypothetical protein
MDFQIPRVGLALIAQFSFLEPEDFVLSKIISKSNSDLILRIADCRFADCEKSKIANWKSKIQWGCSSVGRAVALQAIGREFESPQLHQSGI